LARHHIIPRYEWKERFGNLKGVNAPDNTVILTMAQHAEVHLLLYELNANDLDLQAYHACMGIILKRNAKALQTHKNERRGRRLPKRSKTTTPKKKKRKSRTTYRKYRI